MGKSKLVQEVEQIFTRMFNQKMRSHKMFVQVGTWLKAVEDENRELKQRIEQLEIRIKKLNDYGPTPVENEPEDTDRMPQRLKPGQMKNFRLKRKMSQTAIAALMGVKTPKYARWESGKSTMTIELENTFREIMEMKASDLRSKLQSLGFFQATGKKTKPLKGQEMPEEKTPMPRKKTQNALEKVASEPIITKEKLRKLRLKLGYTHRQMADLFKSKPKHYSNWEYGACRPPKEIARKCLLLFFEHFPEEKVNETTPPPAECPKRTRPAEGDILAEELRGIRAKLCITCEQMAFLFNVSASQYKNWETPKRKIPLKYLPVGKKLAALLPAEISAFLASANLPPSHRAPRTKQKRK